MAPSQTKAKGDHRNRAAPLVPFIAEMMVFDNATSLAFWTGLLCFQIGFHRTAQKLACLSPPDGAQLMVYQRDGVWETGLMEPPFGRGAVIQICVADVTTMWEMVQMTNHPAYVPLREKWRDWGDCLGGQRGFLQQHPDGYLIMLAQRIGTRPQG